MAKAFAKSVGKDQTQRKTRHQKILKTQHHTNRILGSRAAKREWIRPSFKFESV